MNLMLLKVYCPRVVGVLTYFDQFAWIHWFRCVECIQKSRKWTLRVHYDVTKCTGYHSRTLACLYQWEFYKEIHSFLKSTQIWHFQKIFLLEYYEVCPKKTSDHKNTPESSFSERDLTPVKILAKNIEKRKSYSILNFCIFFRKKMQTYPGNELAL